MRQKETGVTRQRNKTQYNVRNAIIRLGCIDRYSGFKYRRSSESRAERERISEFGRRSGYGVRGEERSQGHEVEST